MTKSTLKMVIAVTLQLILFSWTGNVYAQFRAHLGDTKVLRIGESIRYDLGGAHVEYTYGLNSEGEKALVGVIRQGHQYVNATINVERGWRDGMNPIPASQDWGDIHILTEVWKLSEDQVQLTVKQRVF